MAPKVLFVGYDLAPARAGRGGVAVYQRSLATALQDQGCDVALFLGTRHTLARRPRLHTTERHGLRHIELIDSPLRHCDHHAHPWAHLSNATVESLMRIVLDTERPDIVHVHDPRLHPASIVDVALGAGVPVVKTIHNYFDVCPQGELMAHGREVCTDDDEGRRCPGCLASFPPLRPLKEDVAGTVRGTAAHALLSRGYSALRRLRPGGGSRGGSGGERRPLPHAPVHYVERRRAMLERLQRASALHCSSRRSRDLLVERGLDPARVRVIPITSTLLDRITPKPDRGDALPVTFGYITGTSRSKGFDVLLDAFARVPRDGARLVVHGVDDPSAHAVGPNVELRPPYQPFEAIDRVLAEIDVGVVPSVFEEPFGLAGLEFRAARIPVIASEIGGIGEWLEPDRTGVFVPPGDPAALANALSEFVRSPGRISTLQATITPWKTMHTHAQELRELYGQVMEGPT